ncbi:MAG: 1-acyl-sn-glycerol-3-phosphate acyltransferase [Eubacteriaceae bacterium]|nr:1-acyl-sn-glycerol-3-phosphate acyltransferase [Eubacteriaceae bacterium]
MYTAIAYAVVRFFCVGFLKIIYRVSVTGAENVPKEGSLVIACNHKNNIDPFFVASCTKRRIVFLAKIELFRNAALRFILNSVGAVSVNRDGNDLAVMKKSLSALKDGLAIGMFPEGQRINDPDSELDLKPGAAMLAYRTQSPIVPIYISGTYKLFTKMKVIVGEAFLLDKIDNKPNSEAYQKMADEQIKPRLAGLREMAEKA